MPVPSLQRRFSPAGAFALGVLLFAAAVGLTRLGERALPGAPVWTGQLVLKTLLAVLSLGAMYVAGPRERAVFGLRRAQGLRWGRVLLPGLLLGATATLLILVTGAGGLPHLRGFSFVQLVVFVWIYSSVTEELFARGLVQGMLEPYRAQGVTLAGRRVSVPVLTGALLFGVIHLSTFFYGADAATVAVVVAFTFLLGLAAGALRERYESLVPAIAVHVAFNVGGVLAGVAWALAHVALTGRLPAP